VTPPAPRPIVLDASAVLAWFFDEPGADVVDAVLAGAVLSTVNLAEAWQKLDDRGADADRAATRLGLLGVHMEPFSTRDAVIAGLLWRNGRRAGLSLGDRCCLAVARRLGGVALTADRSWAAADLSVPVQLIR
jgi:ribonuclease VapC